MQAFSLFFDDWISHYYKNQDRVLIGKEGDFYTSVSASRFFGGAIANYILKNLENETLKLPLNIIDVGANSLNLINDIYDFLNALSLNVVEKCNFFVVESNAKISLQNKVSNLKIYPNLESLLPLLNNSFFIANEFFDALPCELYDDGKMAFMDNNQIVFLDTKSKILDDLSKIAMKHNIVKSEIPLSYFDFCEKLKQINPQNEKWIFTIFDYGENFYSNSFNIRIFHKHDTFPLLKDLNTLNINLESYFRMSDLTYNVPFLLLEDAFNTIDGRQILFKRQDSVLIENFGILDLLQKFYEDRETSRLTYLREVNKIKTLLNVLSDFKASIYINFKS